MRAVPTREIEVNGERRRIVDLLALGASRLPVSHRLLIENVLRHSGGTIPDLVESWLADGRLEVPFSVRDHHSSVHELMTRYANVPMSFEPLSADVRLRRPLIRRIWILEW